jgi:hypothetical protein
MSQESNDMSGVFLDPSQAFAVMSLFVTDFASRAGDDLLTLIGDISEWEGATMDPAAMEDWLLCVERVRAEGLSGPQPSPFVV